MEPTLPTGLILDSAQVALDPERISSAFGLAFAPALAVGPTVAFALAAGGILAVIFTSYLALRRGLGSTSYKLRNLSPEKITGYASTFTEDDVVKSAEVLAESIVERATEMSRAMEEDRSELRVEICAIGYRKCANDMITLTHLVNEELKGAGFARRWRLVKARKRAVESLSKVRDKLPANALKSAPREKQ